MSKVGEQALGEGAAETLRLRRIVLIFHVVAGIAAMGSVLLAWRSILSNDSVFEAIHGQDRPEGPVVFFAALVAFVIATYDLVADVDLQAPLLLASAVVLGAAGVAFHDLYVREAGFQEAVKRAVAAETPKLAATASGPTASAPAANVREGLSPVPDVRMRLGTGLVLGLVASLDMVVASVWLTFLAERGGKVRA